MNTRHTHPPAPSTASLLAGAVILWATLLPAPVPGCTSYLVSRGASADGSTMVTYAADSHVRYGQLYLRPGGHWPTGSTVALFDRGSMKRLGEIPQAPQTYTVVGFMNEHQLAIGESTFDGRLELQDKTGLIDYGSLMFLALQRARTARQAIRVMAELVAEHGYYSTGESFSIGDPEEVWLLELIGKGTDLTEATVTHQAVNRDRGAVWVARRVPDGYVSAHANQARITTFPLADGRHSITCRDLDRLGDPAVETVYAHDVIDFARRKGYFDGPDTEFSFADAYAPLNFGAARFCEIRVWSMFREITAGMDHHLDFVRGENPANRLPLWVQPERKLTVADLKAFKRDHLAGTEFDLSVGDGAGPFGLPYRWRPLTWTHEGRAWFNERSTATQQTAFSFIAQMRGWLPGPIGGILWFGVDDTATTVYIPMYCGLTRVSPPYAEGNGDLLTYADRAAFWVFNKVAHLAYLRYDLMREDIQKVQNELEEKLRAYVPAVDQGALTLHATDPELARAFVTDFSAAAGQTVVDRWEGLYRYLLVKYLDGNVKRKTDGLFERNPHGFPMAPHFPGYPETWRPRVMKDPGPPREN